MSGYKGYISIMLKGADFSQAKRGTFLLNESDISLNNLYTYLDEGGGWSFLPITNY